MSKQFLFLFLLQIKINSNELRNLQEKEREHISLEECSTISPFLNELVKKVLNECWIQLWWRMRIKSPEFHQQHEGSRWALGLVLLQLLEAFPWERQFSCWEDNFEEKMKLPLRTVDQVWNYQNLWLLCQLHNQGAKSKHQLFLFGMQDAVVSVDFMSNLFVFHCPSSFFFFFGYSLSNVIMKWVVWVCCLDFIVLLLSFSFLVTHSLMWSWNELCVKVGGLIEGQSYLCIDISTAIKKKTTHIQMPVRCCKMKRSLLVVWVCCLDFIVLLLSFSFLVTHFLMWSWNELCESVVWISLSFFFLFLFWYSRPMWSWNELCESVVWTSLSFFFLFLFWFLTLFCDHEMSCEWHFKD